jgi:phosphatidylinositol glycan class M
MLQNEYVHPTFGKIIFATADVLVGVLLYSLSREAVKAMSPPSNDRALYWASCIWLFNPMPANISTRGSSESILGLMVISTLALVMRKRYSSAGVMFGLAVHFKVYPFIYGASILASMAPAAHRSLNSPASMGFISRYITIERLRFALTSFGTFTLLNLIMYSM